MCNTVNYSENASKSGSNNKQLLLRVVNSLAVM